MRKSIDATTTLEARRRQALERMDRNDELVREARAGEIAAIATEAEIASRVPPDEFIARKHDKI